MRVVTVDIVITFDIVITVVMLVGKLKFEGVLFDASGD